jgi:hypothetical protein
VPGPTGPAGTANTVVKLLSGTGNGPAQSRTVQCPTTGTPHATGGGASSDNTGKIVFGVPVIASGAVAADGQQATGWKATSNNANGDTLNVYVVCAA